MADGLHRVRDEIVSVLEEYGISYQDIRKRRHHAILFSVSGVKTTYVYSSGGDPRAHLNARSEIRRLLTDLGAKPLVHVSPVRTTLDALTNRVAEEFSKRKPVEIPPTIAESPEPSPPTTITELSEEEEPSTQQVAPEQPEPELEKPRYAEVLPQQRAINNKEGSYVVHYPKQVEPAQIIAIKLDRDLVVDRGMMLVIPLHRPNVVMEMSEETFLNNYIISDNPAVQAPFKAPKAVSPMVEEQEDTVILPKKPRGKAIKNKSRKQVVSSEYRGKGDGPRSVNGITPQIGRILLALRQAHQTLQKDEVAPKDVKPFLSEEDGRQYSGKVSLASRMSLTQKGSKLPAGIGNHYRLTQEGDDQISHLGEWPWSKDCLQSPSWLSSSIRRRKINR